MTQVRNRERLRTLLREARENRGYDLDFVHAGLCALIDDNRNPISRRTLLSWERGEQTPHPYWVRRLCLFYNMKARELGLVRQRQRPGTGTPREEPSAQRDYLRRLYEHYGILNLPIGPVEGFSLTAVYQPLRLCPSPQPSGGLMLELQRESRDERIFDQNWDAADVPVDARVGEESLLVVANGEEALKHSWWQRLVVLGGPGTGKSTLLKYLVGSFARQALEDPASAIPVFVPLPEFARSGKSLKAYLLDSLQNLLVEDDFIEVLWTKITQGQALICLDSLDEVLADRAELVQKLGMMMAGSHPATRWVVSSRFTDYKRGQFASAHFTEWELLPLDRGVRSRLAKSLLPELQSRMSHVRERASDPATFLRILERHPRIATWGRNPLLFSLAAILFVRNGHLPSSRRELYLEVIDTIIEMRDPTIESRVVIRDIIAALAYHLFWERKGRVFTVPDLIAMLRSIRDEHHETWHLDEVARRLTNSGILEASRGGAALAFLHQTFQEYLAAHYIASLVPTTARHEIDRLAVSINEPFSRQILIELAYLIHGQDAELEDYLYVALTTRLKDAKVGVLEPTHQERRSAFTATTLVVDIILMAVVDIWDRRYCASLDTPSGLQVPSLLSCCAPPRVVAPSTKLRREASHGSELTPCSRAERRSLRAPLLGREGTSGSPRKLYWLAPHCDCGPSLSTRHGETWLEVPQCPVYLVQPFLRSPGVPIRVRPAPLRSRCPLVRCGSR